MSTPFSDPLFVGTSELARLMRQNAWSRTSVGAPEAWPQSVRATVRLMLTSRYAMWMGWGPDLTFFYNDAYARMSLGAKHPWALGRSAREVWAEIWPEIGPRIERVLATGEATWDEGLLLFLERSGFPEETYHTFSYSPLYEDDGRIAGMVCVVTEDTMRVIGERRLALLRELGSELASSQTTADVWMAVERTIASDNRDFPFSLSYLLDEECESARLVACSTAQPGDAIAPETITAGDTMWPIQWPADDSATDPAVVALSPDLQWPRGCWQQPPTRAMVVPVPRQGHARPAGLFIAGLNPYRPLDAGYESFITLFVGQLAAGLANVQAYVAERRRADALAQIDRAKTTFFSNVSHELRTPLTLMLAPVTEALATGEGALTGSMLELVHRNGLHLRKLVNTLLDFSRIEAGRIDASYEPVDLAMYTTELASAFRSAAERAGLRYVVDCTPAGEIVHVDRDMWEKIVFNLISNAFKFTFEGEITVSLARRGERMVLRVSDTGTGIPAEELPRIFERFHRVEGASGRSQEGTGIGLALVQELVRLHDGTTEVESEPGRGTTFMVSVPLGTAHLPADRILRTRRVEPRPVAVDAVEAETARWLPDAGSVPDRAAPGLAVRVPSAPDARIVLADDNRDMRAYLTELLGSRWDVASAATGGEALALVRARPSDLVITDVMMPGLDGFGLLRELRGDARTRHIPVLMLSARAGDEARIEGFQAGADDYVVKPFTARELVARVDALLLRARIRSVEDEHRRRLSEVFTQAPVAVGIFRGPDHVCELANPHYLEIVAGRDVVGHPLRVAVPELEGQGILDLFDTAYRTGRRFTGRSHRLWLTRAGTDQLDERFLDVVCQPTFDARGQVDGLTVAASDVTELATARRAAEDANRAKDEFLAMLGHELRNPLAPILTALQLLRLRGPDAGERERAVIERQVRHLVGLVDDLLDVSRITRGKIRLSRRPLELQEVVAQAIELASPLLEQHQHELSIDVPRQGLGVMADAARLAQVVSNLLTNAAKYTPPGGRIRIGAWEDGTDVVLSVRDSGIGIPPEMMPRLFDLFTQDRQAIDRAQGGLGLGLAIVRSFVALHGGAVTVHSEGPGRGSEFVVRLPRVDLRAAAPASQEDGRQPVPPVSGLRVLVVDDNQDAATMLAELLSQSGHLTAIAHDGPGALQSAAEFRPDVALLDLGLPVMDGFEVARQFRTLPHLQRTRLVAVTGYGQEHDRRRSADAGFDAHLVKPVDLDELGRVVERLGGENSERIQTRT